jgi:hypothetical protein
MQIGQLLLSATSMGLRSAATAFASAGIPIFPCVPEGKHPLTAAGFHDASCDIEVVAGWWTNQPDANIGLPTGPASGVDVVDVDVKGDDSGFLAFGEAEAAGLVDGELARVRTPSGGMHVYFPAPIGAEPQRCWQSASAHIDFRGAGGYVIVPPSALAVQGGRRSYRVSSLSTRGSSPIDAMRLRDLVDPRPARSPSRGAATAAPDAVRLTAWVSRLREGERNHGLYWAACRLVEAGYDTSTIASTLGPAAQHAGLPEREALTTIHSASRQPVGARSPDAPWRGHEIPPGRGGEPPCLP